MSLPLRPARVLARAAALLAALALVAAPAAAQAPGSLALGPIEPEVRIDAVVAEHRRTYHLGVGAFRSVGRAVRLGMVVGGGVTDRDAEYEEAEYEATRLSSRAELVARFTLRTSDAGRPQLYLGAGAGATWVTSESGRGVAHVLVGGEVYGGGWRHAFELGLGGGVRLGLVLRRAR